MEIFGICSSGGDCCQEEAQDLLGKRILNYDLKSVFIVFGKAGAHVDIAAQSRCDLPNKDKDLIFACAKTAPLEKAGWGNPCDP